MEFHLFLPQMRLSFDRFELGLGWGSWDGEFSMFGVGPGHAARAGPAHARDPRGAPGSVDRGDGGLPR